MKQHVMDWLHWRAGESARRIAQGEQRDARAAKGATLERKRASNWADRVAEPGRVYDALGPDVGYHHRQYAECPVITYDRVTKRWVHSQNASKPVTQSSNLVKMIARDTRAEVKAAAERMIRVVNRHAAGS